MVDLAGVQAADGVSAADIATDLLTAGTSDPRGLSVSVGPCLNDSAYGSGVQQPVRQPSPDGQPSLGTLVPGPQATG
jgi:hypothetical protein